jgi:hypothetical protein
VQSSAAALRARAAATMASAGTMPSGAPAQGPRSGTTGRDQPGRLAKAPTGRVSSHTQLQQQLAAEAARDWPAELRGDTGLEGILAEFGAMDGYDATATRSADRISPSGLVQQAAASSSVSSMAHLQSQPRLQSGPSWDERGSVAAAASGAGIPRPHPRRDFPGVSGMMGVASGLRSAGRGGPLGHETRADRAAMLSRRSRNRVLGTLLHPAHGIVGGASATKAGSGHAAAAARDQLYTPPAGDARLWSSLDMVHAAPVPHKQTRSRQQPPRFDMSEAAKVRAAARSDAAASGAFTARF